MVNKKKNNKLCNESCKNYRNLNPMLLYVEQDNLEFSFRKALKERTPEWSTGIVDYYTNQGYGKRT